MKEATRRSIFRWTHIIFGIPIIGYIYDSPSDTQYYAPIVRFVFLPILLLSGLWMWKGRVVRRLISKDRPNKMQRRAASVVFLQPVRAQSYESSTEPDANR